MYKETFVMHEGDIVVDDDLILVGGQEELRQNVENRLGINHNEWFLNIGLGLDYAAITGKGVLNKDIELAVRECCLQDPRVREVREVNITRDSKTRTAIIDLWIIDDNDEEVALKGVLELG